MTRAAEWPLVGALAATMGVGSVSGAQEADRTGRIAGRVIEASSGQAVPGARVVVRASGGDSVAGMVSDLDGRFRTSPIPTGPYQVQARRLGLQAMAYDSIAVRPGQTAIVNFAMQAAAVALEAVVVREARADRATSEAALLAVQQRAAVATDGISAEQIARAPDSDAGEAATRVPGVSVVDNKFVVVRGLSERYSNTLLNGVEVASPEPTRKVVPLDVFPASLLDGIVVTKAATPDRPGDFSGGSVEVRTKEFPEQFVFQYHLSAGSNSQVTGKDVDLPVWSGVDYLGFDAGNRRRPLPFPKTLSDADYLERFSESLRNQWAPPVRKAIPSLGAGLSLGDQRQWDGGAVGYLASVTYALKNELQPGRFFQFVSSRSGNIQRGYSYRERRTTVDWGAIANTSVRLGTNHKLGWKNLYTRNAEEQFVTSDGFNTDLNGDVRGYQYAYVNRGLVQSQVTGDHIGRLLRAPFRLEWKGTLGGATRDEPDNRQVPYLRPVDDTAFSLGRGSQNWFRFLKDRQRSAQADLSVPIPWRSGREVSLKVGGLLRRKTREFDGRLVDLEYSASATVPTGFGTLTPERLFAPENLGHYIATIFPGTIAQPYSADDDIDARYVMVDWPVLERLRVVGGVREEYWRLDLYDGGRAVYQADSTLRATIRRDRDLLWSANATWALTTRMNLRAAAFRSVARPDTRELSRDEYFDLIGTCGTAGNPQLQRTLITNGDLRWEWYPGPGEVVAVSGFYKFFDRPIIRAVTTENNCRFTFNNGLDAQNVGAEIDLKKGLAFLPGPLANLFVGVNGSYVYSRITIDPGYGNYDSDLPLEDQSPFLVNANLNYADGRGRFEATVLYNWYDDRVTRYGFRSSAGTASRQGPNIVEQARGSLDAKVQAKLSRQWTLSLSGKNLTNASTTFFQDTDLGRLTTGFSRSGVSLSIGLGHAR